MSDISQRYARLSQAFADKIGAVPADRWSSASPCTDWNALEVVKHVVNAQGMFLGLVGREMGELPSVDDDPGVAWDAARAKIQHDLEDEQLATVEFEGFFGKSTFEAAVNRFLCMDLVVHGWDLSRAAGLDEHIGADDLAAVKSGAEAFGDSMRAPQAFGPALDPPAGADEQTKVLAFLGRRS
jgi:uncharacterized protein (TIGR03086 family)